VQEVAQIWQLKVVEKDSLPRTPQGADGHGPALCVGHGSGTRDGLDGNFTLMDTHLQLPAYNIVNIKLCTISEDVAFTV
jgi:hypothetical protein